ncbi:MAG: cytoplasmic protein [Peptococcaceae bacterium BICA1-8]|nr:MAG: cytoplasmic protein [Peptococcaceae bacterium BICA1-8]
MDNNDILIRVRYALDIKNTDMVEIFKLGGIEVTKEKVLKMLIKSKDGYHNEGKNDANIDENEECSNFMLESFLNGLIIFKRGKQAPKPGQPERPALSINDNGSVNNILLKKLKIALALTSDDMLDIFKETAVIITKGELSAIFRKVGHKNYQECGDKYARNFLKGLAIKYRKK